MERRPRITLSYAQSLDGRIATATGDSQWISGEQTLRLAHELRGRNDAIIVGIGTVIADNPQLTCRIEGGRNPHRVVLDSSLRTPASSYIAVQARDVRTTVFRAAIEPEAEVSARENDLVSFGIDVRSVRSSDAGLDLGAVLSTLREMGVESLLVEGGSRLLTSFYARRLVDRVVLVSAPLVIGDGTQAVGDLALRRLADAWRGRTVDVRRAGDDVVWEVEFDHDA